jgi:hypothetical protein
MTDTTKADLTQQEIDAMAEAFRSQGLTWRQTNFAVSVVRNSIGAARADERNRCAKVCDAIHARHIAEFGDYLGETYAAECSHAIRALGTTGEQE